MSRADILGELKSIANDAGLTFVAYLLPMAKEEAQTANPARNEVNPRPRPGK
jgi:hypothetical protein